MVDIRPNALPAAILPLRTGDAVIVDQGADGVRQTNPISFTDSVAPVATQAEAQAGTDNIKRMTPLRTKQSISSEVGISIASNAQGIKADSAVQSVNGKTGNSVTLVKGDVGLSNVDNTSDANKPISTATQNALDTKANSSVTIAAGTGLTGGGNLTANRSLALNAASIASLAKADSAVQSVNGVLPVSGNVTIDAEEKRLQDTRTTAIAESFGSNVLFVETAGYSSVGDGGGALYKKVPSEPTHAGKFQSVDGAWWEITGKELSVRCFGALCDGATDDTNAINAALQVLDVTVLDGRAKITDKLVVRDHCRFVGHGIEKSVLVIEADFNMSASSVVEMGVAENLSYIGEMSFDFAQPSVTTKAALNHYPWALDLYSRPRVTTGHLRFLRAWNGINAGGNAGGIFLGITEMGCFNKGLEIDGALDTVNMGLYRVWPFGFSGDVNLMSILVNPAELVTGLSLGRSDGLSGVCHMFQAHIDAFLGASGPSAAKYIDEIHLDGDFANIKVNNDALRVGYMYSTKSGGDVGTPILADGNGSLTIDDLYVIFGDVTAPFGYASGNATLKVNSGYALCSAGPATENFVFYSDVNGQIIVRDMIFDVDAARSPAIFGVNGAGAGVNVQGCKFNGSIGNTALSALDGGRLVWKDNDMGNLNASINYANFDYVDIGNIQNGRFDGNTDATGLVNINLLGRIQPRFAIATLAAPQSPYTVRVENITSTTLTLQLINASGTPVASTPIALYWSVSA